MRKKSGDLLANIRLKMSFLMFILGESLHRYGLIMAEI